MTTLIWGGRLQGLTRREDGLSDRNNNFDVLRLAAAGMVLVGHSFALTGGQDPQVGPTYRWDATLSNTGLLLFFAISGFLVTRSWVMQPRLAPFALKRALRIVPGLVVMLVLTAYVLGGLASADGATRHVTSLRPAEYVVDNTLRLGNFAIPRWLADAETYEIQGVFGRNPAQAMNGPISTLSIEIRFYALLALIGVVVVSTRRLPLRAAATLALGVLVLAAGRNRPDLLAVFAGGSVMYLLRQRIPMNAWLLGASVAAYVAAYSLPTPLSQVVLGVVVPYATVYLAFRGLDRFRVLTRPGDVSYGLYIYGWPVQQFVIDVTGTRSPLVVTALAGAGTYGLALGSWRLVERPALRLKARLTRPAATDAPSPRAGVRRDAQITVAGGPRAPSKVRDALRRRVGGTLASADLAVLELLSTEVVTNAVRHGGVDETGYIDVSLRSVGHTLRVEVRDSGKQGKPVGRPPDVEEGHGFGLCLIEHLASRWSFEHTPQLCVWFELDLSHHAPVTASEGPRSLRPGLKVAVGRATRTQAADRRRPLVPAPAACAQLLSRAIPRKYGPAPTVHWLSQSRRTRRRPSPPEQRCRGASQRLSRNTILSATAMRSKASWPSSAAAGGSTGRHTCAGSSARSSFSCWGLEHST